MSVVDALRNALRGNPFVVDMNVCWSHEGFVTPSHPAAICEISRAHGVSRPDAERVRNVMIAHIRNELQILDNIPVDVADLAYADCTEQVIATVTRGVCAKAVERVLCHVEDNVRMDSILSGGGSVVAMCFHEKVSPIYVGLDVLRVLHMSRMSLNAQSFFNGWWCEINVIDNLVTLSGFYQEMQNSSNGVSRESILLSTCAFDSETLKKVHSLCLNRVPDAQTQWDILLNSIGLISVLVATRKLVTHTICLTHAIDCAVDNLRNGLPATLHSWKSICRECSKKKKYIIIKSAINGA